MSKLYMMVGNIGCGKTTLTKNLCKNDHIKSVNMDDIVVFIEGDYGKYNVKHKAIYQEIEKTIIQEYLKLGHTVIIDRTNCDLARRKKYIDMAKEADQNVHITVFDFGSGEEWQLNRRLSDPRGVSEGQWRGVFEKLKKEYVKPDCDREDIDMIIPKSGNE